MFQPAPAPHQLAATRVLIWGLGAHGGGLAAARFCQRSGADVIILDRLDAASAQALLQQQCRPGDQEWPYVSGEADHPLLSAVDWVVVSPAIAPAVLARLPRNCAPLTSAEALFCAAHRGRRIAVSGTKGKSTTAALLGSLLAWPVAGNSWTPLLDSLAEDQQQPMICELSSFQLQHMAVDQPHFDYALLTNLDCDHLDWHASIEAYHAAKLRLLDWAEWLVLPPSLRSQTRRTDHLVPLVELLADAFVDPQGRQLCLRQDCQLLGEHNAHNAALALSLALHEGLPPQLLAQRLRQVQALPHRLSEVHRWRHLRFIDDSIATNPLATSAALRAIPGPLALILGGSDKGADFSGLVNILAQRQPPVAVHLIGETAALLQDLCLRAGCRASMHSSLESALRAGAADLMEQPEGCVLLSPACASFGLFRDFIERGKHFASLAQKMF